jgi:hypothetical protein
MHTVFLGYSVTLSGAEMIQYFDVDPEHEDGVSKFEQSFGSDYVEPGSFEVYDRVEYENFGFDNALIEKLLPFDLDSSIVEQIDFSAAKSVFYIKTKQVKKMDVGGVKLLGPIRIVRFDFE